MSIFCFKFKQSFIWPLARPATEEETIIIELRQQTSKILSKTGIGSSSGSSRGSISGGSKLVGQYVMLMQGESFILMFKNTYFTKSILFITSDFIIICNNIVCTLSQFPVFVLNSLLTAVLPFIFYVNKCSFLYFMFFNFFQDLFFEIFSSNKNSGDTQSRFNKTFIKNQYFFRVFFHIHVVPSYLST